jgi:hypothetical protein
MKIKTRDKIEEMLISTEKKIHAGEWVRIEVVRMLLNELAIWMIEMQQVELIQLRNDILSKEEEE